MDVVRTYVCFGSDAISTSLQGVPVKNANVEVQKERPKTIFLKPQLLCVKFDWLFMFTHEKFK